MKKLILNMSFCKILNRNFILYNFIHIFFYLEKNNDFLEKYIRMLSIIVLVNFPD